MMNVPFKGFAGFKECNHKSSNNEESDDASSHVTSSYLERIYIYIYMDLHIQLVTMLIFFHMASDGLGEVNLSLGR